MGTAFVPAKTSPASWDAFSDPFVDVVLTELEAMAADGIQQTRSGPKRLLTRVALRKTIMAIRKAPSSRRCARLLTTAPEKLGADQRTFIG
jgi:hypothetical protein